jgi:hypothetical protein
MRALAVLRRRSIASLWSGLLLSALGDAFYGMALMWLGVHLAGNVIMEGGGYGLGLLFSQQVFAHVPVRVGIALGGVGSR